MSKGNAGNNPANRGIGGHIKEGLKNVPNVYNALYNNKTPGGGSMGVKNTVTNNVKNLLGKVPSGGKPMAPAVRAKMVGVGAASVTPLGPVVAVGMGIAKSVQDKKAAQNAQAKVAIKASTTGSAKVGVPASKPGQPAKLTPQQTAQLQKANQLKKTLNNAMPGLNMK